MTIWEIHGDNTVGWPHVHQGMISLTMCAWTGKQRHRFWWAIPSTFVFVFSFTICLSSWCKAVAAYWQNSLKNVFLPLLQSCYILFLPTCECEDICNEAAATIATGNILWLYGLCTACRSDRCRYKGNVLADASETDNSTKITHAEMLGLVVLLWG